MTGRLGKASPRTRARLTGVVYLAVLCDDCPRRGRRARDQRSRCNRRRCGNSEQHHGPPAVISAGLADVSITAAAKPATYPLEVLGLAAEASLMLWLLVMGVTSQRWTEQAA